MKVLTTRREFLAKATGCTAALMSAFHISPEIVNAKETRNWPMIVCSRGEDWGQKVNQPGWDILKGGGKALDAVEKSTNVVELDPLDQTVGFGGLPNENGDVELDASIIDGATQNCGSVASLRHIKTPSSVARLVMERSDHIMLVGKGALKFAIAHGFKKENLLTDDSRIKWLQWKENMSSVDDWLPPQNGDYTSERSTGTINVLGIDNDGNIAGITSTSGLAYKIPGRVGDSPIIGAGLYVDNEVGAAGATGRGEEVIRTCGSFLVVELMRQGMHPQKACEEACMRIVHVNRGLERTTQLNFNDKFIAINKNGDVGCASIRGNKSTPPQMAITDKSGFHVYNGTYLVER
ncbi:N(4)-(beta-N-acetylglucosaminyl)-L-asparaginase [candidate division KSB1 bacterium]|nr:N(4)-(beta-N-acetylglucosaminyl)-L-asparaginase [candidate division KSB1 bacterium]